MRGTCFGVRFELAALGPLVQPICSLTRIAEPELFLASHGFIFQDPIWLDCHYGIEFVSTAWRQFQLFHGRSVPSLAGASLFDPEHLHDVVAEVVDHLHGDPSKGPGLVAGELFAANVVCIGPDFVQGLAHRLDHPRRPDDVENWLREVTDDFLHQIRRDHSSLIGPGPTGQVHCCHRRNQPEIRVLLFQVLEVD